MIQTLHMITNVIVLVCLMIQPTREAAAGPTTPKNPGRLEKCQYTSRVDSMVIDYALWYPPHYDDKRAWPLIVFLHGSGEGKSWRAPTNPNHSVPVTTVRSDLPFLVVFPLMRGTWSINGPAELDVLDTIEDVQKRAHVDPDRIHLTGLSLGGFAGWALAAHYPHLFASLSVFASGGQPELVRNMRYIPTRVYHGTADPNVPADESRRMVDAMEAARAPVTFIPLPGVKHVCWKKQYARAAFYEWMWPRRRDANPKRISYQTRSLRHNRAYWATIESMIDPAQPASIDVLAHDGTQVLVHAVNVGRLLLDPPPEVIPEGKEPEFFVNNEPLRAKRTERGWVLNLDGAPSDGLRKRHGLSGPIQDVFNDSFVVVTPAGPDQLTANVWKRAAEASFQWRKAMTFQNFKFITDTEVTPEIVQTSNLVCFGNVDVNGLVGQTADKLPVKLLGRRLIVNDRPVPRPIAAFVMIYPNPFNPDRYIVVCSGNPQAVGVLGAMVLRPPYLGSTPIEDLVVLDEVGQPLLAEPAPSPTQRWMAPDPTPRGVVFDRDWHLPESVVERLLAIPASTQPVRTAADSG